MSLSIVASIIAPCQMIYDATAASYNGYRRCADIFCYDSEFNRCYPELCDKVSGLLFYGTRCYPELVIKEDRIL